MVGKGGTRVDKSTLAKHLEKIQVTNLVNEDVEVVNQSPLVMMGKGRQGAVFQINEEQCVKVFGNAEDCEREYQALSLGQGTTMFPKLYDRGPLYIVMEIVRGVDVREYLQSQPLTMELSAKLIELLTVFKEIGFERIDHHKRQIFLQPDGSLKAIDVARAIWRDRVYPYPRKLLTSLGEENKAIFLSHVEVLAPELMTEWRHYMRMEEMSREIYQLLIANPIRTDVVAQVSKKLLTTADETQYLVLLEGMMHKVFKEEWVKTMLAQGKDPEKVMEKIDKLIQSHGENGKTAVKGLGKADSVDLQSLLGELVAKSKKPMKSTKKDKQKWEKKSKQDKSTALRQELAAILTQTLMEKSNKKKKSS